ncbi:MAG: 16S rRNA (adenine(1518)-N(6)/adenine(1519)-N(6))-dimethyltransferase RsmA [Candidatus Izemoplasmatales bacterium]|jgi:16S rRNA (adenine1518-N6/adenine1519-N6)-dimethyltransferase|nr:16S rRNA (adenine(1518)-N(6)/adenine(1519)-N(6))-dimethyltransferase RsmA [Candidatus Izemoplasmatales bacterium]MDD4069608.1 16S rRNA (adenine(1518)-N(6)/adenine(1519)-N(6))-dimethyltransferase RsmA [Candidatus Izemoplasmatales bacterium]
MSLNINNEAKRLVEENKISIKKKYSQNFLLDENIITNIIKASGIDENSYVIEVGPGLGALTKHIVNIAKKVLIYEVDQDLIPILNDFFIDKKNLVILNQDFLKAKIDSDISRYLDDSKDVWFISNLPYHITTPIIMKVLEESQKIKSLTIMMQIEVARRLTSKPNTKDYNALSIIVQDQTNASYLFKVPRSVFKPKPNVDSAVINLIRKELDDSIDQEGFYKFVHNAFSQRRKTLVNNLYDSYSDLGKEYFKNLLERNNIIDTIRGEALTLEEFKIIYTDFIKEKEKCI